MSETQSEEPTPTASLNITDIADAVKIMDYASEQGAFKGWANIRQILLVRDRLELFVTSMTSVVEQNTPEVPEVEVPDFMIEPFPPPRFNHKGHQS